MLIFANPPIPHSKHVHHFCNASSILEEDLIEICIQFGHTHHEGVLWYSAIEWIILFHTAGELQVTMHGVIKASMLCEDAIRVRTSPTSAAHVTAYMAVVTGEPSGAQPLPSDGEEEPHLIPYQSPPRWENPTTPPGKPWGCHG